MAVDKIILSHKRAGAVTTHRQVAGCKLCVPDSQADEYAAAHPGVELLVHPDEVVGLWAKREWVRQRSGDHVQMDDDMVCIFRLYRPAASWKRVSLSPQRAAELIDATCETAKKLGAHFFGFGQHAHPLTYNALRPFRFGGYTPGGLLGLREGARVWWPTDLKLPDGDDYWLCLLNAHLHRFCFFDRRFAAGFRNTYTGAGGLQEFRDQADWGEVTAYLQRMFGSEVVRADHAAPDRATKRIRNPSRRQIVLPYNA